MPMVFVNSLFVPQFAREAMIPSPATSPPGFLELSAAPSCGPGLDRAVLLVPLSRTKPRLLNGSGQNRRCGGKLECMVSAAKWLHNIRFLADLGEGAVAPALL